MRQPHVPEQAVVSLLVKDQLAVATKAGIDFAVTVEVGGKVPGAVVVVEIKNGTFADVDEETDVFTASASKLRLAIRSEGFKVITRLRLTSEDAGYIHPSCSPCSTRPASRRYPHRTNKCWGRSIPSSNSGTASGWLLQSGCRNSEAGRRVRRLLGGKDLAA